MNKLKLVGYSKIALLTCLLNCVYIPAFSQPGLFYPDILWEKCLGSTSPDWAFSTVQTSDHGYCIVGHSYSDGVIAAEDDITFYYDTWDWDWWVAKLDSLGNIEWQRTLGGTYFEQPTSVKESSDGGIIICGFSKSVDGDIAHHHGSYNYNDIWVVKLGMDGTLLWEKSLGGSGGENGNSLICTQDGGCIVAGTAISNNGDVSENFGGTDMWLVKLDADGHIDWDKSYGGTEDEGLTSISPSQDGGYILGGYSQSSDGDFTLNQGSTDCAIIKIDQDGNVIWSKTFGGSSSESISSIIQTTEGGYIFAAQTNSFDGDISEHYEPDLEYQYDIWIVKVNDIGLLEWENNFGGSNSEYPADILALTDGSFLCGGATSSTDNDVETMYGNSDYWLFQISSMGELQWEKNYGGSTSDVCFSLNTTNTNNVIMSGYTSSIDGDVTGHHGLISGDYWLVKLGDPCMHIVYYADLDEDGFGNADSSVQSCSPLAEYVINSSDCNDLDIEVHPGAIEVCNNIDDNCSGATDEGIPAITYFQDFDMDGYGNFLSDTTSCFHPIGYIFDSTDCNDTDSTINPLGIEVCNSLDDNCNGTTDEDFAFTTYYLDADSDSFGNTLVDSISCLLSIDGYVSNNIDCVDSNSAIFPGASEVCNTFDDNCNFIIDEGLPIFQFYADMDGDSFGNPFIDTITCLDMLYGFVPDSSDCDDENAFVHPGATEFINGIDDNCNDLVDETTAILTTNHHSIDIYPNPAYNIFNIKFGSPVCGSVAIYNNEGQLIYINNAINTTLFSLEVQSFPSGLYMIIVTTSINEIITLPLAITHI